MGLRGQARVGRLERRGYAMAALLVMVAVLTVLMSVAMPVWRHEAQREKEEELVFRGLQYVRAIRLYQAKNAAPAAEHRRAGAGSLISARNTRTRSPTTTSCRSARPVALPDRLASPDSRPVAARGTSAGGGNPIQPRPPQSSAEPVRAGKRWRAGRHHWRRQQEHRGIDSRLSGTHALQRMAVRVRQCAARRPWRARWSWRSPVDRVVAASRVVRADADEDRRSREVGTRQARTPGPRAEAVADNHSTSRPALASPSLGRRAGCRAGRPRVARAGRWSIFTQQIPRSHRAPRGARVARVVVTRRMHAVGQNTM